MLFLLMFLRKKIDCDEMKLSKYFCSSNTVISWKPRTVLRDKITDLMEQEDMQCQLLGQVQVCTSTSLK